MLASQSPRSQYGCIRYASTHSLIYAAVCVTLAALRVCLYLALQRYGKDFNSPNILGKITQNFEDFQVFRDPDRERQQALTERAKD